MCLPGFDKRSYCDARWIFTVHVQGNFIENPRKSLSARAKKIFLGNCIDYSSCRMSMMILDTYLRYPAGKNVPQNHSNSFDTHGTQSKIRFFYIMKLWDVFPKS